MKIPAYVLEKWLPIGAVTLLVVLLLLGWSDAWARDVLITDCKTVMSPPKPLPTVRTVRFYHVAETNP